VVKNVEVVGTALRFEPDGASGPAPLAEPGTSAGEARAALIGRRYESVSHLAVCDGSRRLAGVVRIEDLLAADADVDVVDLMDSDPPVVAADSGEEVAAWKAVRHGESALAVVDDDGRFVSFVPPRRIVEVLLREHDEDLARLSGVLASTSVARHALEEPVHLRLWHRLPWLLLGLCGAIGAAGIVGAAEGQLHRDVLLAFFVPGIVYMADAVGTQTEALIIRGLSVGVSIRDVVRRELLTGLLVGLTLAAAFLPAGVLLWGRSDVAFAVSLALLAACSTATIVAMALPWLLHRLGRDPAFGSGPLATVVQDLLSLVIYFAVARAVV
jgi:magnesium transporter